jgi:DNA replicative helicase MCM subunit Mcm2 (Cdc46/Mcm family)
VHNRDHVTVATEDLDAFDAELSDKIRKSPADYLPLVRRLLSFPFNDSSARCVELCMCVPVVRDGCGRGSREPSVQGCWRDWGDGGAGDRWRADLPGVQGELRLHEVYRGRLSNNPKLLRSSRAFTGESILMLLFEHKIKKQADYMSKLVKIAGIAIAASRVKAKATHVTLVCKNCRTVRTVPCRPASVGLLSPDHVTTSRRYVPRLWHPVVCQGCMPEGLYKEFVTKIEKTDLDWEASKL